MVSDKRYFITQEDVGLEAYMNSYVHRLEAQIERLDSDVIFKVAELHAEIRRLRAACKEGGMSNDPCCRSCGKEWTEHDGTETLCRKYSELVNLVIAAHIGEFMARARLRVFAEREIEERK